MVLPGSRRLHPAELAAFAAAALLGLCVLVIATRAAGHSAGTQTVVLDAGHSGSRIAVTAAGLVPGDRIERPVDLVNRDGRRFGSIRITAAAASGSLLVTDRVNGLQLMVDRCSAPWHSGDAGYSCPGRLTTALDSRPVIGSNLRLRGLSVAGRAGRDHLLVSLALPLSAGSQFEGLSADVGYVISGKRGRP